MEVVTARLTIDEMAEEIGVVARLLNQFDRPAVVITYGGGCDWSLVAPDDRVTVSNDRLVDFIEQQEQRGIFTLGHCDLVLDSEDGDVQFLLCECSDIHCTTNDVRFFEAICSRWASVYPQSYEMDRTNHKRQLRLLSSSEWTDFE